MNKSKNISLLKQQKENFQNLFAQFSQGINDLQQTLSSYYQEAVQTLEQGNHTINTSIMKQLKMYLWQMQKITQFSGGGQQLFLIQLNSVKQQVVPEISIEKIIESNRQKSQILINKSIISQQNMYKLKQKCSSLHSLTIKSQKTSIQQIVSDQDIKSICTLSSLTKLSIKESRITDKGICQIVSKLVSLKEIDLSYCCMISNDGLKALSGYRFVSIKINGCQGITQRGILSLIATSYNLNYLQTSKISSINQSSLIDSVCEVYRNNSSNFKWLQLQTNIGTMIFINKLSYLTHFTTSESITDREVEILLGQQPQVDGIFFNSCEQLHSDAIKFITSRCKRLRRLSLNKFVNLSDVLVGDIATSLIFLEYLDLSKCFEITDKSIIQLANQLRKLHAINLSKCIHITDKSMTYLIQKMPTLVNINISYCKNITDDSLYCIGNHLPQLEALNIERCQHISNKAIEFLTQKLTNLETLIINFCQQINDQSMILVAGRFRKLKRLQIEWCQVSQKCLALITQNLHELIFLNLNYCTSVYDQVLLKLGRHSPKLNTLKLQSCERLSSKSFMNLFQNLKSLRVLDLASCIGVNDAVIQKLSSNSRGEILRLDLSWCSNITDKAVLSISQFQHQILHLNLHGCKLVTDSGIKWICSTMASLEYLNLSLCEKLTDKSITQIGTSLLNLRILIICDIICLTDQSISSLANLVNIQELHVSGCINITTSSLIALLHNLQKLQTLNISQCPNIFTQSLILLLERMKNMKKIYLASLQVQDNILEMIGQHMTHLRYINLEYCRKITDKGILRLMEKLGSLIRVDLQNTKISQYTKQTIFQQLSLRQNHMIQFKNHV